MLTATVLFCGATATFCGATAIFCAAEGVGAGFTAITAGLAFPDFATTALGFAEGAGPATTFTLAVAGFEAEDGVVFAMAGLAAGFSTTVGVCAIADAASPNINESTRVRFIKSSCPSPRPRPGLWLLAPERHRG